MYGLRLQPKAKAGSRWGSASRRRRGYEPRLQPKVKGRTAVGIRLSSSAQGHVNNSSWRNSKQPAKRQPHHADINGEAKDDEVGGPFRFVKRRKRKATTQVRVVAGVGTPSAACRGFTGYGGG
ncbi:uncharacterized protein LOC119280443 [Triticum dicoccoides]|uniref:uncharacterized protein LOC119280443 n=1 Tax=Triticum dicoccoides TaxID=85692 RepID=UPI000E7B9D9D|nr:uncharacterized protein LOC119280443 [Triticum dicoccoides]